MRKGFLVVGGVAAVAVVAVVAVVALVFSNLDSLIKTAVETYGSEITKARVSLNKAEVSLTDGKGALSGLTVGNPAGFTSDSAFRLGRIGVALDTATVTGDPVVVKEVVIEGPEVTYELGADGNNIAALHKNVEAFMGGGAGTGEAEAKGDGGKAPGLVIENLYVRGGKVRVAASILEGRSMEASLPDIHLTDIGKNEGGATPGQVAARVLTALNEATFRAVRSIGVGATLDSLKSHLGAGAEGAAKAAGDALKDVGGSGGEAVKKLFGR